MSSGEKPLIGLVILTAGVRSGIALVHLSVSPEVGDHREMPTAVLDLTLESCNQCVSFRDMRNSRGCTYASRLCGCTCESATSWVV